jgi:hypothetical protein
MADAYEQWLVGVREALDSINMPMEEWQRSWPFLFRDEYAQGTSPADAAMKANRFWWLQQNKSLKKDCRNTKDCWLPRGHQGDCQPISPAKGGAAPKYERGDYVKVEFEGEAGMPGEWMWVRVHHSDDEKKLVFGTLDNAPVNDYHGKVELGSQLAVSYSKIREHKKPIDFTKTQ